MRFWIGFLLMALAPVALADTAGPRAPGTVAADNSSGGSINWSNPDNAKAAGGGVAESSQTIGDGHSVYDYKVRIVKGGVIGETDKASAVAWPINLADSTYGGATDHWGETWTPAAINASNFGVAIAAKSKNGGGSDIFGYYLVASNFGFAIPEGATINGITATVKKKYNNPCCNDSIWADIDYISLTVAYTPNTTPTVADLGPAALTAGSWTADSAPTLTFTTADTESNPVAYELEVDDSSDFGSPVYAATSSYAAPGDVSTTTPALTDASYYWRVRVGDGLATSTWSLANADVAFKLDATVPTVGAISFSGITQTSFVATTTATDASGLAALPFVYHNLTTGQYESATAGSLSVTGLAPATAYQYEVGVQDAAGNFATSSPNTVTTLAEPVNPSGQRIQAKPIVTPALSPEVRAAIIQQIQTQLATLLVQVINLIRQMTPPVVQ